DSSSIIAYTCANCIVAISPRRDHDLAAARGCVSHRIQGINEKIQQHLLQLDRVTFNYRQFWLLYSGQLAGTQHCISFHHCNDVHHEIVQIDAPPHWRAFFHHSLNSANHIPGAAPVSDNVAKKLAKFAEINVAPIDEALSGTSVADDSGQ